MRTLLAAWAVICCSGSIAFAAAKAERITAIRPDGSVVLSASGNAVFSDIVLPDAALVEPWLAEHLLQQEISFEEGDTDRYGRTLIRSNAEEKMLQDGIAILYASEDAVPAGWHDAERTARAEKRGVWASKDLLLTPEDAAGHQGAFHVVEGTITRIYESKTATYLNFGEDWHSDFSVTIPPRARRSMKPLLQQIKPGSRVRVRGYIYDENGPMIRLMKADNLELR